MSSSASTRRRKVAGERARSRAIQPPAERAASGSRPSLSALRRSKPEEAEEKAAKASKASTRHTGAAVGQGDPSSTGLRGLLVPGIALLTSLVLLAGMVGLALQDSAGKDAAARAATSTARTSLEQMLSYNHKNIDKQAADVEALLTGAFKDEFATAMEKDIKPLAVKNQTVVQAKVSDIGVMDESEGSIKVMAFVNQAKVSTDQKQPAIDQNRVMATLTKVGDRWLISKLEAF